MYGAELAIDSSARRREIDAVQRAAARVLLRSPAAPNIVTLGDLGWRPWSSLTLERGANLLCRLTCASPQRLAGRLFRFALAQPGSWSHDLSRLLDDLDIPPPSSAGLGPGCTARARAHYLRATVRRRLAAVDLQSWRQQAEGARDPDLQFYARCVHTPGLAHVHSWRTAPAHAASWCRLRSGCSALGGDRGRRHALGLSACRLCGSLGGSVEHVVVHCPALAPQRADWRRCVQSATGAAPPSSPPSAVLLALFSSEAHDAGLAAIHARFAFEIEQAAA